MQPEYDALTEIQREVLGYLEEHPSAADTCEGIRQWWLLQRMARYSQERVEQALNELKDAQLVDTRLLIDGRVMYRRSRPA